MTNPSVTHRGTALLVCLLLWIVGGQAMAQSNGGGSASIAVEDAPLDRALEQVATATGISLVYDFALVEDRRAACTVQEAAPKVLLRCLLDEHPISYVRSSKGTYILKEAVQRPPQRGRLTGIIRGAEQGRPLINAHVQLPESAQFAGTVTDSTGRFRITGVLPGPHTVVVSHLGYEPHKATVYVPPNGAAHHEAALAPAPIAVDSLVIDGNRYAPSSARGSGGRVSTSQLLQSGVAGTPDVFDAANTLIGVTTSPPYADLHIQGGDTGGHTMRLDGVPIRNPASAGRLLGAFSPLALDGLTARKAGFGALHGNALSGSVELKHDLSGRGARYGTVQLDSRSLNARLRGTTTLGTTPVTAMVAGRVSVWDVYQEAALLDLVNRWSTLDPVLAAAQMPADTSLAGTSLGARAQPDAGFYDLHGAARFDLGPAERLYVSAYHGGSHLGADLVLGKSVDGSVHLNSVDDEASIGASGFRLPTYDEYAWTNTAAQARYEAPVTTRTMGTLRVSASHYAGKTQSEVGTPRQSPDANYGSTIAALRQAAYDKKGANEITELDVEGQLDVAFSSRGGLVLTAGATYQGSRFRIGNAFAPQLWHRAKTVRLTTATEATVGLGPHATLEGGVRLTALPSQSRLFAEPRGALHYDRSVDGLGSIALNVRGGLYRQFTTQFELNRDGATAVVPTTHVWLPILSSMRPSRSYHLAADLTWEPNATWQVDLEGYRKWQPHLLAVDYSTLRTRSAEHTGRTDPSQFLGSSRGYAYGGGLQVEYEGRLMTSSLRYAYSRTRRTFPGRFDGRLTPVPWSEPHRLTLGVEVPLGNGVVIESQGEGVWGRSWGYRRAYYAYLTPSDLGRAWDRIRMDRPGTHVLPPLYRLDTGLSITQSWNGVDVQGRLGVVNVLNRENVADWSLQPKKGGEVSRWARPLPGRRATVSIQVRY